MEIETRERRSRWAVPALVSAAAVLVSAPVLADDGDDGTLVEESFTTDITVHNPISVEATGDIIWEEGTVFVGEELPEPSGDGVDIDVEGEEGKDYHIHLEGDVKNAQDKTVELKLDNGDNSTIVPLASSFGFADGNENGSEPISLGDDGEDHQWIEFCAQCEDHTTAPEEAGLYENEFTVTVAYDQ